jgi:hypothetical protein
MQFNAPPHKQTLNFQSLLAEEIFGLYSTLGKWYWLLGQVSLAGEVNGF